MSDSTAIRFRDVTKEYRVGSAASTGLKHMFLHPRSFVREARAHVPFRALEGISFEVRRGECVGVIGPNGSGKSTTLSLAAGVLRPSSGTVETAGRVCPLLELGAGFHHDLTGRENIVLNGVLLGMTRREVRERFDRIVDFSGLREFLDRPIRTYSSGMLARLGFSVAVHLEPAILLVDEVLAVGDAAFQAKCLDKIAEFQSRGVTILFVSHDMETVRRTCERALLFERGRLVADGSARAVVDRYLGPPAVPSVPGHQLASS